ncbi:phage tail tape measure protein [Weissella paramesenteroides]|uniref:phage tail tape measure protein n=1 Tax=Weissella paramesenteroides TaxID=1249 RepID=UPI003F748BA1
MAGSRIKGITIEINGDTKGLDKALASVNSNANKTQSELRDVNKLLKLDPGNTELIAQKQKLLAQAITQTGDKLKTLKDAQAQVDAQFAKGDIGEEQYRAFQREIASTEATLKGYKSQLSTAENSQQELSQSTQRLQNYFKATSTSVDDFKSVLGTRLVNAIKSGTASSESLDRALQMIAKESGIASSDMSKLTQTLDKVDDTNVTNASKAISDLGNKTNQASGKMEVFKGAAMAEGLSQVADAASEAGGAVIDTAMQFGNAQSSMQNTMGLTASQAKNATDVVKNVFNSGVVDSVDEANESVQTIINSFGDLANGGELQKLSTDLTGIARHGGVDIKDAANASSQAMKSMGLTGRQATDLIAKGLQDGLNKNDDFLDTVNEYAPTFKDAGISADGMLSVLNAGMQDGAFNTDKVADAVKEFQLRLTSGQLDEPMKQFSQSTQDAFAQFKAGKATSADVMASVGKDLSKMPADKAKQAVQGLGTQFEDLGQKASSSLLEATKKTEDATGATKKMNEQTPGEKWQSALNTLKTAFSDVVIQMTPLMNKLSDLIKWFNNLNPTIKTVIGVFGAISVAIAALAPIITMIVGVIGAFGVGALLPIIGIITAVIAVITGIVVAIKNWGSIVKWLQGVWSGITTFFSGLWNGIKQVFTTVLTAIGSFIQMEIQGWTIIITTVMNVIKTVITTVWNVIKTVVSTVLAGIKSVIETIWNGIKMFFTVTFAVLQALFISAFNILTVPVRLAFEIIKAVITVVMQAIVAFLTPIIQKIQQIFTTVFNAIKDFLTTVWNGIKAMFTVVIGFISAFITSEINGWKNIITIVMNVIKGIISSVWNGIKAVITSVLNVIKPIISATWNSISNITRSVFNAVRSFITSVWNAIKSVVNSVVNSIKSFVSNAWNGIKSVTSSVFNAVKSTASSVWNGIKSVISSVVNGIRSTVSNVWNGIRSVTTSVWNGIKSAITGPIQAAKGVVSGIVDSIKRLFNFRLKFPSIDIPHIPLPHFNLSGSFNPLKGKIPHVGVNWYAKGGVFTKPTLFANNGGFNGIGEAGSEAALPLNAKTLGGIGKGIAEATGGLGGDTINVTVQVLADTSAQTIKKLTDAVTDGITRAQNSKARAIGG